jgi:hypothetical protein
MALPAFDAHAELSAALAEFQAGPRDASLAADAARAAGHGLAWFARPSEVGHFQVVLRHKGGAETSADGQSISDLLAGLLGHPLALKVAPLAARPAVDLLADALLAVDAQASEPEQEVSDLPYWPPLEVDIKAAKTAGLLLVKPQPEITPAPSPAQSAAESLAAATGGAVVAEVVADPEPDPNQPLTDEQKAVCVQMISSLEADKQKAFKIAFRDAFRVPREAKSIAPLITEVRHMNFCDRWSIEAAGGVAP